MHIRSLPLILMIAVGMSAQAASVSVSATDANGHLLQHVEPTVPPLAKAVKIGGTVKLQINISASGDVVSVKTLSGHPMLVTSAIEAVRKWKYRPFEVDNKPVQVITDVELEFPGGMSENESAVRNKYFPIEDECRSLINERHYADAEARCRDAVEISNQLPKDVILERSEARSLLANSIYLQGRYAEAIPIYEDALKLDHGYLKPDDADLASDYWNLGRAYAMTGQLNKADGFYATAVSSFEAAILSLPAMKDNYSRRLKRTLNEYAQLKIAEGQTAAATELTKKAAGL